MILKILILKISILKILIFYLGFCLCMDSYRELGDSGIEEIFSKNLIGSKDRYGNTLLHKAVCYENEDIVLDLLCYQEIDVNAINNLGDTPLHLCIYYRNLKIFKHLVFHPELDVNLKNRLDESPLHLSIKLFDTTTALKLLLKIKNIDIISKNKKGQDAIMIARFFNKEYHLKLLENYLINNNINYYIDTEFEILNPRDYFVKINLEDDINESTSILNSSNRFFLINITPILGDIFPYLLIIDDYKTIK